MINSYKKKYLKYKKKYLHLKSLGQSGGFAPNIMIQMNEAVDIIKRHKTIFDQMFDLFTEIGGIINLNDKTMQFLVKGDEYTGRIENVVAHPIDDNVINWHTHPNFIASEIDTRDPSVPIEIREKSNKIMSQLRFLPSYTDLSTCIYISIHYDNIDAVVHKNGIFFYSCKTNLSDYLKSLDKETQSDIIDNYIIPNIGSLMHDIGLLENKSVDELTIEFQTKIGKILQINDTYYGFDTYFIKFE
jgi:hypothetical protein